MEIVQRREVKHVTYYRLNFDRAPDYTSGYSFECDAAGNVNEATLPDAARANFAQCLTGADHDGAPLSRNVGEYSARRVTPRIGKCHCGRLIELENFTNTCACGRDFNASGQELAPRSQWGEETGENVSDILAADTDNVWED